MEKNKNLIVLIGVGLMFTFASSTRLNLACAALPADIKPQQAGDVESRTDSGNPVAAQVVSLTGRKLTFDCGEPVFLIIHLKNQGTAPVSYARGRSRRPRLVYRFEVSPPSDTSTLPNASQRHMETASNDVSDLDPDMATLEPGKEFSEAVLLNAFYDLNRPGNYDVVAKVKVALPDGGLSPNEAVSKLLSIKIVDGVAEQLKMQGDGVKTCTTLDFSRTWITDDELKHLCALRELKELHLFGAQNITDAGLERVSQLPSLETLDISETQVTGSGLKGAKSFVALKSLDLRRTKLTDESFRYVADLSGIETLLLDDNSITDAGLKSVRGLSRLHCLSLERTLIVGTGLQHLEHLSGLNSLYLCDTKIADEGLKHLRPLANLKRLSLSNTLVTDSSLMYLNALLELTRLDLSGTGVTNVGLMHLKHLTRLEYLDLSHTHITGAGLGFLKQQTNLNSLFLDDDLVADADLECLKGLTRLSELCLRGTQVTDAGLRYLAGLTNLYSLELAKTNVTAKGIKKLQQALPNCRICVSI